MVKPVGAQENGKMLKPTGPQIDTTGEMAMPLSAVNGKNGKTARPEGAAK